MKATSLSQKQSSNKQNRFNRKHRACSVLPVGIGDSAVLLPAAQEGLEGSMIDLTGITKTYSTGSVELQALKGVSFSVQSGEFIAIMGPSGSGKSTIMQIIGALDTPTSGTYRLEGRDVSMLNDDELADIRREKIGFIFQSFNLLPRTTVLRNVMLPLVYAGVRHSERVKKAVEALTAAGLAEGHY